MVTNSKTTRISLALPAKSAFVSPLEIDILRDDMDVIAEVNCLMRATWMLLGCFALLTSLGCGASKMRLATEQLVISDAVDKSVAKIDFSPLSGQRVYLDTKYMTTSRPSHFVSPDYVISSLRQQMMAYDVRLMDKLEDADVVLEARCGVLGNDGHDVSFGIPAGNAASSAATSLTGTPVPPILPEISLAKRMDQVGANKIAVFAYNKETKQPIWQSGISTQISTAKDFWVFGMGPIQRGSIYGGTRFAGDPLKPFNGIATTRRLPDPVAAFQSEAYFNSQEVRPANHQEPIAGPPPDLRINPQPTPKD